MSLKTKKVNNFQIELLPDEEEHIPRSSLINSEHAITLIPATMNSGKTTLIYNILKNYIAHHGLQKSNIQTPESKTAWYFDETKNNIDKPTYHRKLTVCLFCGSMYNDPKYAHILDLLKRSGVKYNIESGTYDEDQVNLIEQLMQHIDKLKSDDQEQDGQGIASALIELNPKYKQFTDVDNSSLQKVKDILRPISGMGNVIVVLDDLPKEFKKNTALTDLIKKLRHRNILNIICASQYVKDFTPDMFNNATNVILYKNMDKDKLKHVYERMGLNISYEKFLKIYEQATNGNHNFMMIDKPNMKFYKNFNEQF